MGRSLCSEVDRVWALRLIREARVDLSLAQQARSLNEARELLLMTVRKAELAVGYALGYHECLDFDVEGVIEVGPGAAEPPVRVIMKLREVARRLAEIENIPSKDAMLGLGESIIESASHIVEALVN
ncbi:MAG: hypothetical protein ACUVTM_07350 [Candidatus Bathyarchaeia archaeon]